jgi:hypothetical protein
VPFAGRLSKLTKKPTLSIVFFWAEIQTRHVSTVSEKHYHLCHLYTAISEHQCLNIKDDTARYWNISRKETVHEKSKRKDWEE